MPPPWRSAADDHALRFAVPDVARASAIPTDKLKVTDNKTNILLLRTGEKKRGVVGLFQPGLPGEVSPSLTVRLMGINAKGSARYLVSLYCSAAVLTEDALGVLDGVDVTNYHDYES